MPEHGRRSRLIHQLKGLSVDGRRSRPIRELKLRPGLKEQRKLSAFGAQPKTFFAAKDINVLFEFAFPFFIREKTLLNHRPIDPAKTRPVRLVERARHHAGLVCGRDRNGGVAFVQQGDLRMLFHKGDIVRKSFGTLSPVRKAQDCDDR